MSQIYNEKVVLTLNAVESANLLNCLIQKPNKSDCWITAQQTGVGVTVRFTEAGEGEGSERETDITDYSCW